MQSTQASLERPLDPLITSKFQERRFSPSPHSSINKEFMEMRKPTAMIPFLKEKPSPIPPQIRLQGQKVSLEEEHIKATNYLSTIVDPLWKDICLDLLNIMGPASVLKIRESTLGEFSSQNKSIDMTCPTEEIAAFVQQYTFVILGSLQRYFPFLKHLRVKVISSLPCH